MAQTAAKADQRQHGYGELTQSHMNGFTAPIAMSLNSQQRAVDMDECGADIPDIPLKRPANRIPSDLSFNHTRFEEAWDDDDKDWTAHLGPINPNATNPRKNIR